MKTCKKCKTEKPLDQFGLSNGRPTSYCRECVRKVNKARHLKVKQTGQAYDSNYKVSITRTITYAPRVINAATEQMAVSEYLGLVLDDKMEIINETFKPRISKEN